MTNIADVYALLSLDSYSRGYAPAVAGLSPNVGDATFKYTFGDKPSGFSGVSIQCPMGRSRAGWVSAYIFRRLWLQS